MALISVEGARFAPSMDSFLGAIKGVMKSRGFDLSFEDLWGFSGLAFRMQTHRTLAPVGLLPPKWDETYPAALRRIGWECTAGLRDFFYTDDDLRLLQGGWMGNIERHLEDGLPAISFGLHGPGFGIIYGLDDETELYQVSTFLDGVKDEPISVQDLGSKNPACIFVLIPQDKLNPHDPIEAAWAALASAYAHYTQQERDAKGDLIEVPGDLLRGSGAYQGWIQALASRQVDPHWGAAYTAGYYIEARTYGAAFLKDSARALLASNATALISAAVCFTEEAELLKEVANLFPAGDPSTLEDAERRIKAAHTLQQAQQSYDKGMNILGNLVPDRS